MIINSDGSVFHLHVRPEHLADKVILVGDPGRVDMIATYLSDIESSTSSREFHSVTGRYKGVRMTVLSTGIGCDNIDIVMNELDALANVDFNTREVRSRKRSLTILRIGTCGVIQPDIPIGSYIFSRVSIGFDGLLNWYGDRDAVVEKDIEEAFLKHVQWDRYLPTPYFQASMALSAVWYGFRWLCRICWIGWSLSASETCASPISRWRALLSPRWPESSGMRARRCVWVSHRDMPRMPMRITSP